jgi:hypothetical protein
MAALFSDKESPERKEIGVGLINEAIAVQE